MEWIELIAPAGIAAITSVIVVCIAQNRARKLAYFQMYVAKKAEAYSAFWEAVANYETIPTPENYAKVTAALHRTCLFASEDVYKYSLSIARNLQETHNSGPKVLDLVDAMRFDLDCCQRLKFERIQTSDKIVEK